MQKQVEVRLLGLGGLFMTDIELSGGAILSANLITNKGEIINSYTSTKIKPLKKRNTY